MHCYFMAIYAFYKLCQIVVFTDITEPQNLIWNLFVLFSLWRLHVCSDNSNKLKKEAEVLSCVSSFTINFLLPISGIKNFRNLCASLGHIMILAKGNIVLKYACCVSSHVTCIASKIKILENRSCNETTHFEHG